MALADFFDRAAVAASQTVAGFRREEFARILLSKSVGIAFGDDGPHARQLVDLGVRLAARLYPKLSLQPTTNATGLAAELARLAQSINSRIDVTIGSPADIGLVVGQAEGQFEIPIYVGCSDWTAFVDSQAPQALEAGELPFGPGIAASVGMANVFRGVLGLDEFDRNLEYATPSLDTVSIEPNEPAHLLGREIVLVGCGAIGNAAVWALSHVREKGVIHLVDDELLELSNLQRYVLGARRDVGKAKVDVLAKHLGLGLTPRRHRETWARFAGRFGHRWPVVLVAVDSAAARCEIQTSLPRRIANAWTQPGDLGVSLHSEFGRGGACLACLYLHDAPTKNEDQIVAEALGIADRLMEVRNLLHLGLPVSDSLLEVIAARLGRDSDDLKPYSGLPIRRLYVEGICGGALVTPSPSLGVAPDLHVPLAHQSALAGVLLAATLVAVPRVSVASGVTRITRLDVLHPIGQITTQPAAARSDGRCLCEDADFRAVYNAKWNGQVVRTQSGRRQKGIPAPSV